MLDYINVLAVAAEAAPSSGNPLVNILNSFHVEWPLLIAQVVNVVIVLWVLKKFAFGPIVAMLEARRARIIAGEAKIKQIEKQLADSVETTARAISQANDEALRMVTEAKQGAESLSEQKIQEAIAQAQLILARAEIAAKADRERLSAELKREFGRLVVAATSQVTGKVLSADDQKRINEDALVKVEG
jgi:F-type H+-transporting ATPase subunit b